MEIDDLCPTEAEVKPQLGHHEARVLARVPKF
jgi:hypothetical protein